MTHTRNPILDTGWMSSDDLIEQSRFMECELIFDFLVAAGAIFHFAALALVVAYLYY